MRKKKIKFTNAALTALPIPDKTIRHVVYSDATMKGLIMIITYGGTKTFYFRHNNKKQRNILKLGHFPILSAEDAQNRVFTLRQDIANGKNPFEPVKITPKDMTLRQFFDDEYMPRYATQYKKQQTYTEDKRVFDKYMVDLHEISLANITRNDIDVIHKTIGATNGKYMANRCLKLIKAMYNIAIEWGYVDTNPVTYVRPYSEKSRDRFLQPDELHLFMNALNKQENVQAKQLILLILLSEQRKMSICSLQWENVDFNTSSIYLPDTKNGEPQHIPLTSQAMDLLKTIKAARKDINNPWVFPSDKSKSGHREDPKAFFNKILKESGIKDLRIHDLRRTMASYQAIIGSSMNIIGKSLGHKSINATAVYARLNLDAVRDSMQKATDEIFKLSDMEL